MLLTIFALVAVLTACEKEEEMHTEEEHEHEETDYAYHAHIESPNADDKELDDLIHVHINFESHTGETIHNIDVRFFKADDLENPVHVAANEEHVHGDGEYQYHADIMLNAENGFSDHGDYILKATVFGAEERNGEESEELKFYIH
ncbi:MAG: hypothetical protein AB8G22_20045 [Saprospiraceae bacterium]